MIHYCYMRIYLELLDLTILLILLPLELNYRLNPLFRLNLLITIPVTLYIL